MLTSHQFSLVVGASVPRSWQHVRFYQSIGQGGYCLWGFPAASSAATIARVQQLGGVVTCAGECASAPGFRWVHFTASPSLAAQFALKFHAPVGATPLLVTGKGTLGKRRGARVLVQSVA
ncbi:hypothetical protein IQ265_13765 [Nodosilinea sp. LEGE 06152]|uniref:hypothetical protein n=1 Tax=Nodosilinea sp. LEGE 06152 TaxID=2777966 RepID=UPI00187E2831|nr:hypothetical protein [Nodosilinea sp. LEGE 06152]MBE9157883.1 hypothetical protein [Nodosilinea sp. LEGE 06152]